MERLPATLELAGLALFISVVIAVPVGVLAAVTKDKPFDYAGKIVALLGQSLPSFWLGIVLMWIFAVTLGWLPTSGVVPSPTWSYQQSVWDGSRWPP